MYYYREKNLIHFLAVEEGMDCLIVQGDGCGTWRYSRAGRPLTRRSLALMPPPPTHTLIDALYECDL